MCHLFTNVRLLVPHLHIFIAYSMWGIPTRFDCLIFFFKFPFVYHKWLATYGLWVYKFENVFVGSPKQPSSVPNSWRLNHKVNSNFQKVIWSPTFIYFMKMASIGLLHEREKIFIRLWMTELRIWIHIYVHPQLWHPTFSPLYNVLDDCPTFITQTFITSDIHHLRHSSPLTFITSDIHHPLPRIRRSSPHTLITSSPRGWWMSEVMNVWGDECLNLGRGWWMSEVMNVWK